MPAEFRPLRPDEHPLALDLWDLAFSPSRAYFERYYRDDPWYEPGDTLGAFEGERLVSAVHVCRRPLEWAGRTLRCGAIANVATHPDHRRQGLSRELLRLAIGHMEDVGLDFSMLFTGQFSHYGALGWQQVPTPSASITLLPELEQHGAPLWPTPAGYGPLAEMYWKTPPRPLLLHRPERYFRGWVGWEWEQNRARLLGREDVGCAVVGLAEDPQPGARVLEWFPMDAEGEAALLHAAARLAAAEGRSILRLPAHPYHGGGAALQGLGTVTLDHDPHMMLRNLRLQPSDYAEVIRLYQSGDAVWWPSDGF